MSLGYCITNKKANITNFIMNDVCYLPLVHRMVDPYFYSCLSVRLYVRPFIHACMHQSVTNTFPQMAWMAFFMLHTYLRYLLGLMHIILDL